MQAVVEVMLVRLPRSENRGAGGAGLGVGDGVAGPPDGDVAAQLGVFGAVELVRPRRAVVRAGANLGGEVGDQLGALVEVVTPSAGGQGDGYGRQPGQGSGGGGSEAVVEDCSGVVRGVEVAMAAGLAQQKVGVAAVERA